MQLVDAQTMPDQDLIVKDLGPLSWVIDEVRKSFDVSIKSLKRFLLEANAAQSDLSVFDAGQLRNAKLQFHQVFGALKVLEIEEAAILADAMEAVAGKFVQRPDMVTEDAVRKLEHASFAVLEYLESLLASKNASSIGLFVQYRDIKGLAGFDRVHPADLWVRRSFQWLQPEMAAIRSLDYSPSVRVDIDSALLKIMLSADTTAASELSQLSLSLAQSQTNGKASTFWKICAAFFEAIAQKLIPVDIYAKRTAAGIVVHYNNLKHGDWVFSDKFMQNMLFLCGQAKIEKRESSPSLFIVQKTWALKDEPHVNYEISQFGRFDPAVLSLSKKRIIVAKELWTALSGGDIQKIRSTAEQFKLVSESLIKLYPSSRTLASALTNVSDLIVVTKQAPNAELAMEVATAMLYLEAVFDGWGSDDLEMELRAAKLAQRIENVRSGGQAETVEPWIEELYRRVSDRESMGSVVGELRICLTDIEKSIDQYFRSPSLPLALQSVPEKLRQMRGIFSVLGLDEAGTAVMSMRDHVEEFRLPNFDFEQERVSGGIDKFGNNLGALGFLIDMLNYQPTLVKKLFVFDSKNGTLNPLMGRVNQTVENFAPSTLVEQEAKKVAEPVFESSVANSISNGGETTNAPVLAQKEVATSHIPEAVKAARLSDETELKDVFLEEAAEVIEMGLTAANSLLEKPENLEEQSTLRRAFHTLKGSSRMVGFNDFGEAGWFFEQVVNTRLIDQTPFDEDICKLSIAALNSFKLWVDDLRQGVPTAWSSELFRQSADAMRIEGRLDIGNLGEGNANANANANANEKSLHDSLEKIETDDEALLHSLEGFELLELSTADVLTQEITATENTALLEITEQSDIANAEALKTVDLSAPVETANDSELAPVNKNASALQIEEINATEIAQPVVEPMVARPVVGATEAESEDKEQFKVIGALKIGIPLYNVYLNEADEWSRCLVTELDEWAIEHHKPLSISTVNFAHSLAGSSATVGFYQLSSLAKKLEYALDKVFQHENGTETEAVVFAQVAEECRRLLHQFAAGFLEEPKESVVARLDGLKVTQTVLPESNIVALPLKSVVVPTSQPVEVNISARAAVLESRINAKESIANHQTHNLINDDDIELVDSLDADLFHIFEEEARELLPRIGGSLRQWASNPDDLSARSDILRTLHTLKGSSRLAGAMRLGELSHRMESEIESIGSEKLSIELIEPLLSRLDSLQNNFESISKPSENLSVVEEQNQKQDSAQPELETEQEKAQADILSPKVLSTQTVKTAVKPPAASILKSEKRESRQSVRVRARLLDRLVNQAGEVMLTRTRIESELGQLRGSLGDLTGNLDRLRQQLRDVEFQAETQMQSRMEQAKGTEKSFDPLEFDRFTRVQELTRMMAESVNDVATVQRNLQRTVDLTEDDLVAQARQTRDLQRDLLRTRMEEFESISDRLYRVVRQAAKDSGKQVKLDIVGGSIEMDRGVLERMTPSFEHLLRNCIAHGLEHSDKRLAADKDATGAIAITLLQDGNDVIIEFSDDGAGLNYDRIREQAISQKLISKSDILTSAETVNLMFMPGLSTAAEVTELSGRGIGLDIVRAEVIALGGRIDVSSDVNKWTKFKLVLPLTTAVTQVVMMRAGSLSFGVPSHLVEVVRRAQLKEVEQAYANGHWDQTENSIPFYWSGALLQASQRSSVPLTKTNPVIIFRSAGQRIAMHVDEIFGNKEVVIKNLGPQLARLPGLAGMAILVSGAVALIYNPVALAAVYGATVQQYSPINEQSEALASRGEVVPTVLASEQQTPLILVVDDSITVRRVTQRMLQREGFRVVLAVDGLQAIEKLNQEIPAVVLSDIEMPRMDGFDLVRNIRSDSKLKHLPIVMITSRIAEKHRDLAMELGVNAYLGKPYSEEGLLTVLRQHTAKKLGESEKV
jgi:chemosensory pili system protein ChpA (sensor histidine kinase/response regulator)